MNCRITFNSKYGYSEFRAFFPLILFSSFCSLLFSSHSSLLTPAIFLRFICPDIRNLWIVGDDSIPTSTSSAVTGHVQVGEKRFADSIGPETPFYPLACTKLASLKRFREFNMSRQHSH